MVLTTLLLFYPPEVFQERMSQYLLNRISFFRIDFNYALNHILHVFVQLLNDFVHLAYNVVLELCLSYHGLCKVTIKRIYVN